MIIDAFRRDRRRFGVMLLSMASVNPLMIYQAAVLVRHPSILSLLILVFATVAGHLAINVVVMISRSRALLEIISGCLNKGASGNSYSAKSLFARLYNSAELDVHEDMERWLVRFNGLRRVRLDDMIKIHVGPGQCYFRTYSQSQLFTSYIFISSLPDRANSAQKFIILHEICHCLTGMGVRPVHVIAATAAHAALFFWLPMSLPWDGRTMIVMLSLAVVIFVWRDYISRQVRGSRLASEVLTDATALQYLQLADVQALSKYRKLFRHLVDPDLTATENAMRQALLRRHMELILAGEDDQVLAQSHESFASEPPVPLLLSFTVMLVGVSFLAAAPGRSDAIMSAAVVGILLFAFIIAGALHWIIHGLLDRMLMESFPPAPDSLVSEAGA